jgi:hypothetical protein
MSRLGPTVSPGELGERQREAAASRVASLPTFKRRSKAMAERKAPAPGFEGHDEPSKATGLVRKGTFEQVGTVVNLSQTGISPNVKTGSSSGGEQ